MAEETIHPMARLTWEQLDRCQTADEIADLLRAHQVKGVNHERNGCPLAVATRWCVEREYRYQGPDGAERLTNAERAFIFAFDYGDLYRDLLEK